MTFVTALLTGLGVGSGGLYVLYLTLIKDVSQAEAQGINLVFFITATLAAAVVNLINKRISFFPLLIIIPFGMAGAVAGCHIASVIDTKVLSVMFGVLIATAGIMGFVKLVKKR